MSATFIPALLAGHALFIGLTSSTLAATPSSTSGTQHLGLLVETTDTLMSFSSRDGTTTTKVSTGLSSTSTSCLTLTLWCPANAGFVWARLYNEDTGALVSETQITLTLPATTTFLGFAQAVGNGALASNASVSFIRYYARFL